MLTNTQTFCLHYKCTYKVKQDSVTINIHYSSVTYKRNALQMPTMPIKKMLLCTDYLVIARDLQSSQTAHRLIRTSHIISDMLDDYDLNSGQLHRYFSS